MDRIVIQIDQKVQVKPSGANLGEESGRRCVKPNIRYCRAARDSILLMSACLLRLLGCGLDGVQDARQVGRVDHRQACEIARIGAQAPDEPGLLKYPHAHNRP
ncbi:MAG: hypothetical protein ACOH1Y_03855 [Propionicimonas sp.]